MNRKVVAGFLLTFTSLLSLWSGASGSAPTVVKITAKKFEFTPSAITVKKGVPVILELTSEDRTHGFSSPGLNLRADIAPGKPSEVRFTPEKTGEFNFFCDVFCGSGHDTMEGKITVVE
jgi:cytochrome c oxidase subunit II